MLQTANLFCFFEVPLSLQSRLSHDLRVPVLQALHRLKISQQKTTRGNEIRRKACSHHKNGPVMIKGHQDLSHCNESIPQQVHQEEGCKHGRSNIQVHLLPLVAFQKRGQLKDRRQLLTVALVPQHQHRLGMLQTGSHVQQPLLLLLLIFFVQTDLSIAHP